MKCPHCDAELTVCIIDDPKVVVEIKNPPIEAGSVWESKLEPRWYRVVTDTELAYVTYDVFGRKAIESHTGARTGFLSSGQPVPPSRIVEHGGRKWVIIDRRCPKLGEWASNIKDGISPFKSKGDYETWKCDILLPLFREEPEPVQQPLTLESLAARIEAIDRRVAALDAKAGGA